MIKYLRDLIFILCLLLIFLFGSSLCRKTSYDKSKEINATEKCTEFETDPPYFFEDPENDTEEEKDTPKETEEKSEKYVLNIRSKKIHKTTCGTGDLILPENREVYEGDIEDLYKMGYTQCGNCFK